MAQSVEAAEVFAAATGMIADLLEKASVAEEVALPIGSSVLMAMV